MAEQINKIDLTLISNLTSTHPQTLTLSLP